MFFLCQTLVGCLFVYVCTCVTHFRGQIETRNLRSHWITLVSPRRKLNDAINIGETTRNCSLECFFHSFVFSYQSCTNDCSLWEKKSCENYVLVVCIWLQLSAQIIPNSGYNMSRLFQFTKMMDIENLVSICNECTWFEVDHSMCLCERYPRLWSLTKFTQVLFVYFWKCWTS